MGRRTTIEVPRGVLRATCRTARFSVTLILSPRNIAAAASGSGTSWQAAAIATAMIPFLIAATVFSYYGLQRRKWQQGESND